MWLQFYVSFLIIDDTAPKQQDHTSFLEKNNFLLGLVGSYLKD